MESETESDNTYIEVQELLNSLTEADIARLLQSYTIMGCEKRAGMSASDVFSEVACKVLSMERGWPRNVATIAYLNETGRSVISNEEKKYSREVAIEPDEMEREEQLFHDKEHGGSSDISKPENQLIKSQADAKVAEWIGTIKEIFRDDQEATCFISQKLAEMKKAAILIACKLTDQTYRNVEKRIKDKIRKKFPKGFPWWEIQ